MVCLLPSSPAKSAALCGLIPLPSLPVAACRCGLCLRALPAAAYRCCCALRALPAAACRCCCALRALPAAIAAAVDAASRFSRYRRRCFASRALPAADPASAFAIFLAGSSRILLASFVPFLFSCLRSPAPLRSLPYPPFSPPSHSRCHSPSYGPFATTAIRTPLTGKSLLLSSAMRLNGISEAHLHPTIPGGLALLEPRCSPLRLGTPAKEPG